MYQISYSQYNALGQLVNATILNLVGNKSNRLKKDKDKKGGADEEFCTEY